MRLRATRWLSLPLLTVVLFILAGALGPVIAPQDPLEPHLRQALSTPSWQHLLGTDHLGRDELSRILVAARASLVSTVIVLAAALLIGIVLGVVAGWCSGLIDAAVMRLVDVMLGIPVFILALVVLGVLGPGLTNLIAALSSPGGRPTPG